MPANNMNHFYLLLMPKVEGVCQASDFHPIALDTFMVKFLPEVLACSLQLIINELIGIFNLLFVKGKGAIDCYVSATEILNWYKRSN